MRAIHSLADHLQKGAQLDIEDDGSGMPDPRETYYVLFPSQARVIARVVSVTDGFCQGSRQRLWPTRARLGIGPPLTMGADEDAVLGLWLAGRDRALRAHRPGLPPVPLPRLWQT